MYRSDGPVEVDSTNKMQSAEWAGVGGSRELIDLLSVSKGARRWCYDFAKTRELRRKDIKRQKNENKR